VERDVREVMELRCCEEGGSEKKEKFPTFILKLAVAGTMSSREGIHDGSLKEHSDGISYTNEPAWRLTRMQVLHFLLCVQRPPLCLNEAGEVFTILSSKSLAAR